jgi:regulator of sigma E protease
MVGGVLVNFLLAMFIYSTTLYVWGEQYLPTKNVKYGIMCDSVALDIGLRNGDKILTVDHVEIENFNRIFHDVVVNSARSIQVERDGQEIDIPILAEHIAPLLKSEVFIATRIPFIVDDFSKDSPARTAGILVNDKVVALNDMEIEFFDEFRTKMSDLKGQEVAVTVIRDGESITHTFKATDEGKIGVWPVGDLSRFFELHRVEYSFFQAIPAGISKGFGNAISYLKQLKLIFTPKTKAYESLGGFIKIGSFFPKVWNWQIFWEMTALLSIILAIMNLLPIPALDGGHVMFLLYEIVSGRKPGDKFMEYAQIAGMMLLLALLLYANGNDVVQLFKK